MKKLIEQLYTKEFNNSCRNKLFNLKFITNISSFNIIFMI